MQIFYSFQMIHTSVIGLKIQELKSHPSKFAYWFSSIIYDRLAK